LVINQEREQPKICAEVFKSVDDRFKVLHHRVDTVEEKTEEINSINNVLARLETLVTLQQEDGIRRDKLIAEISETQAKISNSLDVLSSRINSTETSVDKLSKKIDEVSNDNKMKLSDIIKNLLIIAMSMGFGAIVSTVLK
jgi:methyl-accepting chemotaxis protein